MFAGVNCFCARPARLALAFLLIAGSGFGQTVGGFVHRKIQNFEQTSAAAPAVDAAQPFQFGSLVTRGFATINSATLAFPGSASPRPYELSVNSNFAILDTFATRAQLDGAYGSGTYNLTVNTTSGVFSRSVFFAPVSDPTTPTLTVPASDWRNDEIVIDAAADYALTWSPFANAEAADLIQFTMFNPILVVRSFPAAQTSYVIPAGTLEPNRFYLCDLTFIRTAGASAGDFDVGPGAARVVRTTKFRIRTTPAPLALLTAASRKHHGLDAGFFDLPLPLSGTPAVECRSGGNGGGHTLVFTFNNVLVSGGATVTNGIGIVPSAPNFLSNMMTVRLNGVANAQTITVKLSDVTDQHGQVLPDTNISLALLLGDVNGDQVVNAGDSLRTRAESGRQLNGSNYRADVNFDHQINVGDALIVRAQAGTFVPVSSDAAPQSIARY
jgi:hypothetical protein